MDDSSDGVAWILLLGAAVFYFVPTIVAARRSHRQAGAILALNFFLGWTLVGWVVALVWSVMAGETAPPRPLAARPPQPPDTRPCPHCAEDIKVAAKVCRWCNREVEPLAVASRAISG